MIDSLILYFSRRDSHGKYRKVSNISKADFTKYLSLREVTLKPGLNSVVLSCNVSPFIATTKLKTSH